MFAALSYAVTQSGRGGGTITKEQTTLDAAKLIQYFGSINAAVTRMLLTGTRDYELNFYYQSASNYVYGTFNNNNCTTSSCLVFDPLGGGVVGQKLDEYARNPAGSTPLPLIYYTMVPDVGSTAPDIVMSIQGVKWELCEEVNRQVGLSPTPTYSVNHASTPLYQFAIPLGPISSSGTMTGVTGAVTKKMTFCICSRPNEAECRAYTFDPRIVNVIVAR